MSMIRRLFAVSVLLFSLTALSAQYQALEKSLQETALSFLSYVPQELGDFTLSLISYDTEEVSWSASELAVVQLEFSHEGETHSRTIMFLVDEQVSPEQQVLREVKKILPELAQLFFDLDAQGITLIAQPAAPLLAQAADPELAQPGDLLAVQAADGSLIASLRVDEQDGEFRYLALEWAERELVDHMLLTPRKVQALAFSVAFSGTSVSFSPYYTFNWIPSSYLSFHTGLHGCVSYDASSFFIAPMIGMTSEILFSRIFPSLAHHSPVNRFSVRGTVDAGYGISVSQQVQASAYSEISGGLSYRFSPFLTGALAVSYRVQENPFEDPSPAASVSMEVRL